MNGEGCVKLGESKERNKTRRKCRRGYAPLVNRRNFVRREKGEVPQLSLSDEVSRLLAIARCAHYTLTRQLAPGWRILNGGRRGRNVWPAECAKRHVTIHMTKRFTHRLPTSANDARYNHNITI